LGHQEKDGQRRAEKIESLKEKRNKLLQASIVKHENPRGLMHLDYNILRIPKGGHEEYFDKEPAWFVIPDMDVAGTLDWDPKKPYKVMVVAGCQDTEKDEQVKFYRESLRGQDHEKNRRPGASYSE
jgi:hypothetical protein